MEKVFQSAEKAIQELIFDGMKIAAGGFGLCGIPEELINALKLSCLLYTSPSPRDQRGSRMPSSA